MICNSKRGIGQDAILVAVSTRVLHPSGDRRTTFSDSEGIVGSTEGNTSVNTSFGVDCETICHNSVICDPIDDCEKWKNLKLADRKRLVNCQRHMQARDGHDKGRCASKNMSRWSNNAVCSLECGICKSKFHCAELCDQNKSITKLHKVTTMAVSAEMLPVLLQASYVMSLDGVRLGTLCRRWVLMGERLS